MTRIKICGVTLLDDAARVAASGADFIGLNFWPQSKRYLAPERARLLSSIVHSTSNAKVVGVFVDADFDALEAQRADQPEIRPAMLARRHGAELIALTRVKDTTSERVAQLHSMQQYAPGGIRRWTHTGRCLWQQGWCCCSP